MNRRKFIAAGLIGMTGAACGLGSRSQAASKIVKTMPARPMDIPRSGALALIDRAKAAMATHESSLLHTDRIGIADYSLHSAKARFHIVDMASGNIQSFLVAHGKGSDPRHTGWLQEFSNIPGSEASSGGSYMTSESYVGKHGTSRRLKGLDPSNNMAEPRAIVIHGAWYAEPEMVETHGKLGRSQGCFAFSESDLPVIMERLGPGRLLYADKL
ncbi:murein L,D-transpeptidase catalytic domain family protein [Sphingorhabdus sp. SMR4y]|uniref:murein L,D-transpeptidase catalytic domain family protein n=1 Tax=Sphingorhabdus sp. SMR4y TaxID=2584094 RepID=UPI000B5EEFA5|nr:murein L,D-transpeptidase catalytic domain family protein [Sphingorhabdus sp. SMR4y]ASK87092.1 L,D-transpeptidase catalytic domain [Sphingorhabdus sp. SMR4y]